MLEDGERLDDGLVEADGEMLLEAEDDGERDRDALELGL